MEHKNEFHIDIDGTEISIHDARKQNKELAYYDKTYNAFKRKKHLMGKYAYDNLIKALEFVIANKASVAVSAHLHKVSATELYNILYLYNPKNKS